jgi:hypothetical protein
MKWFPVVALLSACHANALGPVEGGTSAVRVPVEPLAREVAEPKPPQEKWLYFKAVDGAPDACSDELLREYFGEPLHVLSRAPLGRVDWKKDANGDVNPEVLEWAAKGVRAFARAENLNANKLGERGYAWVQESKWWDGRNHLQAESVSIHFKWNANGDFLLGVASVMRVDIGDYCLSENVECRKVSCFREVVPAY